MGRLRDEVGRLESELEDLSNAYAGLEAHSRGLQAELERASGGDTGEWLRGLGWVARFAKLGTKLKPMLNSLHSHESQRLS